jgi:hypothetical protein
MGEKRNAEENRPPENIDAGVRIIFKWTLGKSNGSSGLDYFVRFEVFTAVTMKNVFWDVTPCGYCRN